MNELKNLETVTETPFFSFLQYASDNFYKYSGRSMRSLVPWPSLQDQPKLLVKEDATSLEQDPNVPREHPPTQAAGEAEMLYVAMK